VIAVFKGEKTIVFWVGLLVFGYSLTQFCSAIWQTIYYVLIYPRVFPGTLTKSLIEAQAVYPLIPLIISGVIFAVIGRYMMKKGVKREQPSTQN
jgi:hypothetical protein